MVPVRERLPRKRRIEGRSETRPNPNYVSGSSDWRTSRETITHTSASVTTKDRYSWQYGHLVVRAKVTNLEGTSI